MSFLVKVMTGAAGLAALTGLAAPLAARVDLLAAYDNHKESDAQFTGVERRSLAQCKRALEEKLAGGPGYGKYGVPRGARILSVTTVDRRNRGLVVAGLASSGSFGTNTGADLAYRCVTDARGDVTATSLGRRARSYRYLAD